jgi:hypothetical protein
VWWCVGRAFNQAYAKLSNPASNYPMNETQSRRCAFSAKRLMEMVESITSRVRIIYVPNGND